MSLIFPKVIGHRGAKGYAPENTLPSFHTAADMGVEYVEFDVKLTKDHEPVVFHDDTLERTTNGSGLIAEMTYKELQELDAGSWFDNGFVNTKIPHLEDVLDLLITRNINCNIEIKPCPGREKETAEIALDHATRIWPDDMLAPLISSFSQVSLEAALDMAHAWPRGFLIDNGDERAPENWADLVKYLEISTINCNGNAVSEEEIAAYIETGLPVLAYTINDPLVAEHLFDHGLTAVFSDTPDVITEAIETFH